jgi:hypothetical protein
MICAADIAAVQDTLYRGLESGQLQPVWHGQDGHAEIPLTPRHALQVWSGMLPVALETSGNRPALNHTRYSRVLAGEIVEYSYEARESRTGAWLVESGRAEHVPGAAYDLITAGIRQVIARQSYVTMRDQFHRRLPAVPLTVILAEIGDQRPGDDAHVFPQLRVDPRPLPPDPLPGLLTNAVRDALARLDDHAWHCLTAGITPSPLKTEI